MLISIFLTSVLIEALNKQVKAAVIFSDVRGVHCRAKVFKTERFWCNFNLCDFMVRDVPAIPFLGVGGILNKGWWMSQFLEVLRLLSGKAQGSCWGKPFLFQFKICKCSRRFSEYSLYQKVIDARAQISSFPFWGGVGREGSCWWIHGTISQF